MIDDKQLSFLKDLSDLLKKHDARFRSEDLMSVMYDIDDIDDRTYSNMFYNIYVDLEEVNRHIEEIENDNR